MWFVCVCVCVREELGKVLLRIPEGTGTIWKNQTDESIILKWIFKKQGAEVWWIGFILLRTVVSMGVM